MLKQQSQQMKQLSSFEIETEEQKHLERDIEIESTGIKHYGNIKMLTRGRVHVSVGPDWIFSIVALVFLSAASYGLYKIGFLFNFGILGKIVNYFFIFFPPLSFLATLFRNPGIYDPEQNYEPKRAYCNICKLFTPKGVYHCKYCDVCIEDYDHHCPWMSKCIGKKNLICFYIFVGSIPAAFFYFCYLIYLLMQEANQKKN